MALRCFARRILRETELHGLHAPSGLRSADKMVVQSSSANRILVRENHILSRKRLIERLAAEARRKQSKVERRSFIERPPVPPPSDPLVGSLSQGFVDKGKLVTVLARPDLLITRSIEWANVAFGFEQQNRYVIVDPRQPQAPVGYIFEESNFLMRQLLRTRRHFDAVILDGKNRLIFQVRRPVWLINSTIFVEIDGQIIGEVHRRWHLWRRIYDLYIGKDQFGRVENPGFWNWTFDVSDADGGTLAVVDRNWRGIGYEFFTDAGQYVVRFGEVHGQGLDPQVGPLEVSRILTLEERAVVLALAISLDNDYFSRHSGTMGIPVPLVGAPPE